ncbi:MAG: FeoB-associated Cys-rich membrane protein [Synergistaceae bacterium]
MSNIIVGIIIFGLLFAALFFTVTKKASTCCSGCSHCSCCEKREATKTDTKIQK